MRLGEGAVNRLGQELSTISMQRRLREFSDHAVLKHELSHPLNVVATVGEPRKVLCRLTLAQVVRGRQ